MPMLTQTQTNTGVHTEEYLLAKRLIEKSHYSEDLKAEAWIRARMFWLRSKHASQVAD